MKFELPGQFKGPECNRLIAHVIKLRKQVEIWLDAIQHPEIKKLTVVLRVDGTLGSFGKPGIENIEYNDGTVSCDLVIADANWASLSDDQIVGILRPNVLKAIRSCVLVYNIPVCETSFPQIFDHAE